MNNKILEELKTSPYYKDRIIKDYDIIAVFYTGSEAIQTADESSDYDLIVLTSDYSEEFVHERLKYKDNLPIHWYYVQPAQYCGINNINFLQSIYGRMLIYFCEPYHFLYINPKYQYYIDFLLSNKKILGINLAYHVYELTKPLIYKILHTNELELKIYSKHLYDICCAAFIILQKPLDLPFLTIIKRTSYSNLTNDYKQKIKILLIEYQNHCESLSYNYEQESQKLYNMLLQALPGDK